MFANEVQASSQVQVVNNRDHWGIRLTRFSTSVFTALLTLAESPDAYVSLTHDGIQHRVRMLTLSGVRQYIATDDETGVYTWDAYLYIKREEALEVAGAVIQLSLTEECKHRLVQILGIELR